MGVGKAVMSYTNAFKNAGIGIAYADAFKALV